MVTAALFAVVVVLATIVGAESPASAGWWRAVPVAVGVLGFAAFERRAWVVALTAVLGYLLVIGFLVNQFGQLSWHGVSDVDRLMLIGSAAGLGFVAGAVHRLVRRARSVSLREDLRNG